MAKMSKQITTHELKLRESKTDWARVARDERQGKDPIVDSDDTALSASALATAVRKRGQRGPQRAPTKVLVALRVDRAVVEHFKRAGEGWQTRMNAVLAGSIPSKASGRSRAEARATSDASRKSTRHGVHKSVPKSTGRKRASVR